MGIFSQISSSYKKTKKIQSISKIIGKQRSMQDIYSDLFNDNHVLLRAQKKEELFDLCETFPSLQEVMNHYSANRDQLSTLYDRYDALGFGQWVKGHYTLVSSFAFPGSLDYLLANYDKNDISDKNRIMYRLHSYFLNGEMGKINPDE